MRRLIVFPIFAMALSAADSGSAQMQATPRASQPVIIKTIEIPAGAVETGPGSYRYTDKDGKIWIYRQTPFGVLRAEEKPAVQTEGTRRIDDIKATEDGDTIRFERTTPFGVGRWQKKKSELNEVERAVWERQASHESPKQE